MIGTGNPTLILAEKSYRTDTIPGRCASYNGKNSRNDPDSHSGVVKERTVKSRDEVSAGGVVFRREHDDVHVLVCKDAGYHKWVLPKGLVNKGESLEETAVREVHEEVGVQARIVESLGEEKYVYTARGFRVFKTVHYFLMEYESGSEFEHDHEMDEVKWVSIEEAIALMGYKGAQDVLRRAQTRLHTLSAS